MFENLVPPNPLIDLLQSRNSPIKSSALWEMQAEHLLSIPMRSESVSKRTLFECFDCCACSAIIVIAFNDFRTSLLSLLALMLFVARCNLACLVLCLESVLIDSACHAIPLHALSNSLTVNDEISDPSKAIAPTV